jgi:uncharacterized metal-binding protein YceD (DUF177 family)
MANAQAEFRKTLKKIEKAQAQRRKSFDALTSEQQKAILNILRTTDSILESARCLVSFSYEDIIELERNNHDLTRWFGINIEEE